MPKCLRNQLDAVRWWWWCGYTCYGLFNSSQQYQPNPNRLTIIAYMLSVVFEMRFEIEEYDKQNRFGSMI